MARRVLPRATVMRASLFPLIAGLVASVACTPAPSLSEGSEEMNATHSSIRGSSAEKVGDLTGTGTSSNHFGVGGTDLGIPVRQPDGKIAYIFGDTFRDDGVGGPDWRSPVLLRSKGGIPKGEIRFTDAAGGSHAKQILDYRHDSSEYTTWLPSDAITIGKRMYLHFMVHKNLGNVRWSQIAYSDDNGENWKVGSARWDGDEDNGLRQLWTWARGDDGFVYVLSTSFGRKDGAILHRVSEERILDKDAYQPWSSGHWKWSGKPTRVLDGKVGEMCLRRIDDRWVLSYFNFADYDITVKVFDGRVGELSRAKTYKPIKGGEWGRENGNRVAQLYGGYIHPDSTLRDLHIIVSQWNTEKSGDGFRKDWPYRSMQFVARID